MSKKRNCAYCGNTEATLTREHLWPAALHSRLLKANEEEHFFYLSRLEKDLPNEPKIKDVCEECNNVILSALDSYICHLFDKYFIKIPKKDEKIVFKYDYHKLTRWLLKMCFNSARVNDAFDRFVFRPLMEYILGYSQRNHEYVRVFCQLTYPEPVADKDVPSEMESNRPIIFAPTGNRVGHMLFRTADGGQKVLRAVHLRAYSFPIAFFQPGENELVIKDFVETFTTYNKRTYLLREEDLGRKSIRSGAMGAWESVRRSRSKLEFSDGNGQQG